MRGYKRGISELNRLQVPHGDLDDETAEELEDYLSTESGMLQEYYEITTLDEHYALINSLPAVPGTRWTISEKIYEEFLNVLPPVYLKRDRIKDLTGMQNAEQAFAVCEAVWGRCYMAYWRTPALTVGDECIAQYGPYIGEENQGKHLYWAGFVWLQ